MLHWGGTTTGLAVQGDERLSLYLLSTFTAHAFCLGLFCYSLKRFQWLQIPKQ